ncbi:MAG: hypothetical protein ACSHX6_04050 [Akkermansiaceae bacterium]
MLKCIFVFYCVCLVGCSTLEVRSFPEVSDRLAGHKVKKRYWKMPADEAAMKLVGEFKREGDAVKVVKDVKPRAAGYVTFSGSSSMHGSSNKLVRFGKGGLVYEVAFHSAHMSQAAHSYETNKTHFSCTKSAVNEEMSKACEVIQYLEGMEMVYDADQLIRSNYVSYNPPMFFDEVMMYDEIGHHGRELQGVGKRGLVLENWVSDYAEVILKNADGLVDSAVEKVSNVEGERAALIGLLSEVIHDETIPYDFLSTVVEGVGKTCLVELEEDLRRLSKRVPVLSEYVKKYKRMDSERSKRMDWLKFDLENEDDILYQKLSSRYYADSAQKLRVKLDVALRDLGAVGDEERIRDLLDEGEDVGAVLYDLAFRDKAAFTRLSLKRLKMAKSSYDHYQGVRILLAAGQEDALFGFLERADDAKFSLCARVLVSEIRDKKPEWKLRLQAGLVRYVKGNEDPGVWTSSAMAELMPDDDPDYFDLEVVGECLKDPKVKVKIIGEGYFKDEARYETLLKKWVGLVGHE